MFKTEPLIKMYEGNEEEEGKEGSVMKGRRVKNQTMDGKDLRYWGLKTVKMKAILSRRWIMRGQKALL